MVEWGEVGKDSGPGKEKKPVEKVNCLRCVYFRVTWDPERPRGCDLFGFKGQELPSVIVRKATGKSCPAFVPKVRE